jgi:hypothetical protein
MWHFAFFFSRLKSYICLLMSFTEANNRRSLADFLLARHSLKSSTKDQQQLQSLLPAGYDLRVNNTTPFQSTIIYHMNTGVAVWPYLFRYGISPSLKYAVVYFYLSKKNIVDILSAGDVNKFWDLLATMLGSPLVGNLKEPSR